MNTPPSDPMIQAVNDHKAHLIALQAMIMAVVRALPIERQATALQEWDTEKEAARNVLLHSSVPEDLVQAFDRYVRMFDHLRRFPPSE